MAVQGTGNATQSEGRHSGGYGDGAGSGHGLFHCKGGRAWGAIGAGHANGAGNGMLDQ